ncbi:PEP-CTERM system TPR-repeat protein PrsT [Agarivorans sp. TSD2052]|uniref:XrtA/PEP-CTERM system TPR-repeat protein PrsT n=1 Tax=Agarivorans sp. TSD2052 TaxID=2937286 RepID=UPI002010B93F|nr:XrtA/PEP-CTERM system TPR-repeat protein PrsT [Agarivorans sp. TSD2052]UPW19187.1 PEP-CTERM system TPR-repeat protein PrsT [Agarivorans sp. TSD2052]
MKRILATTALTIALTACGGDTAEQHLSNASSYLSENNQNAAIIELKNAIKKDANLAQARLTLGKIYLERGNYLAAEKELERALELNADKDQLIPLLARTYLNQGQPENIEELLLENRRLSIEVETEVLAIHALALFRNGQVDKAKTTLSQAQDLGIEGTYSTMVKASISAAEQQLASANETINQLSQEAPDNTDVWLLKGHLASLANDNATAVASYQQAVELAPEAVQFTLYLAQALVKNKQFDEAEPYLDKLLKVAPNHMLTNQLKAYIFYEKQNYLDAYTHATRALQNGSNNPSTQMVAGVSAYRLNNNEQALPLLSRVVSNDPSNQLAQRLLVSTQFRLGQLDGAIDQLNQQDSSSLENAAFLSNASLQLNQLGRNDEALNLAEKAAKSGGLPEKTRLGLLLVKRNDPNAINVLQEVLDEYPAHSQAFLGQQAYYYQNDGIEQVIPMLREWLANIPQDQAVRLYLGTMLEQQEKYDEALQTYQDILKVNPQDLTARLFSSSVLAHQGKTEEAYKQAYQLKSENPENQSVFKYLATYANQINKLEQVQVLVDEQLLLLPASTTLLEQKALLLTAQKEYQSALSTLTAIPELQRNDRHWRQIGDLYLQTGQPEKAHSTYQAWLDGSPLSLVAYLKNINVLESKGQLSEAVSLSNRAAQVFKTNPKVHFLNSVLLLKAGDTYGSQNALNKLPPNQLETPAAIQQQGFIYSAQQEWGKATSTFEKLYAQLPSVKSASRLIQSYKREGKLAKAQDFVTQVIEEHGELAAPLKLQLAELQMDKQPQQALQLYKNILQNEPNNIIALNNIAWVLHQQDQHNQALEYALKAHQLKPELAQVKDTYGYMLLKSGKASEAQQILEQSYQLQASNEIGLHYVEALIANKQTTQAKELLDKLVDIEPALVHKKTELEAQLN